GCIHLAIGTTWQYGRAGESCISRPESAPSSTTLTASRLAPACRNTSDSGTPSHTALLTADPPAALPAHSRTASSFFVGDSRRSAILSSSSCATRPSTLIVELRSESSGSLKWSRTKKRSAGVIEPGRLCSEYDRF